MAKVSLRAPHFIASGHGRTHLSPQEAQLLYAVMARPLVTWDLASEVMWPDPDDMPDFWLDTLRSVACRLNRRLRGHGWRVRREWGIGWRLERA